MQYRKKTIIFVSITTAVILLLLLGGGLLWYMPHFWLDKLQNEYLLHNRNMLRVKNIQAGAFNKYILSDIQIGDNQKPLISAPYAELQLENRWEKFFTALPIKKLIIYDCKVKIESSKRKVYINGVLLEKFVKQLTAIPPASNGNPLFLELHSQLAFGKKAASANLLLKIKFEGEKIDIRGVWSAIENKNISGSWQAFIDPAGDYISVTVSDYMTEIFMQEILLRSGVPAKATALLDQALLFGEGNFSGTFNNLQIKELNYQGKVEKPVLSFYKYKMANMKAFTVNLQKNNNEVICRIPALNIDNKKTAAFEDITITYNKNITFSANCNIRQLAADYFSSKNRIKIKNNTAARDILTGQWSVNTDKWSFSRKTTPVKEQPIHMETEKTVITLQPEKFALNAYGKASSGIFNQEIKYKNLEIYYNGNQKKLQSAQGTLNARSVFGYSPGPDKCILGINSKDISAVTPLGIVEIPGLSASIELTALKDGVLDVFASVNGNQGRLASKQYWLSQAAWSALLRLQVNADASRYHLKNLNFKSDLCKFDLAGNEYTAPVFNVQLQGIMEQDKLIRAQVNIHAQKVIADKLESREVSFSSDYDSKRDLHRRLQGFIACQQGKFPLSDKWYVSQAVKAKLNFCGSNWQDPMEKIILDAHLLDWQKDGFSGTIQNSKWQILREKDSSLNCSIDFDFMKLNSQKQKFGSGQFGKSSLSLNMLKSANGDLAKLDLLGILNQTSWVKGDYHVGSESVQCEIKLDKSAATHARGKITMNQTNILGADITASTPVLSSVFTASSPENITGNIHFAAGSISDPAGNLELRKAQFNLPIFINTQKPVRDNFGKFTAEDVLFKQKHEGSFTGEIRHFMRLPESMTDTLLHQIELKGELASDKFGGKKIAVASIWQLPPEKNSVKWQFSMPESRLTQMLRLSDYINLPIECTALKGTFTLDGTVELSSGQPSTSVIKLNNINTDWQLGQISVEGLTGASVLNLFDRKVSLQPHDISVEKILWNNIVLKDNELNVSLDSAGKLQIANWHGSLLGGKFRSIQMAASDLNKPSSMPPAKFVLEDMPLTQFFNIFGIECFISDALLNGDIQLNTQSGKLFVDKSLLSFKSPTGKVLQLKLKDPAAIKMRDLQFRDFTMAILNAMKCYQANFNFSTSPEEIVMQLKAEGTPAEPVPFVYQGRSGSSPFRPANPGEAGFSGEIELNVNLKLHPGPPGA